MTDRELVNERLRDCEQLCELVVVGEGVGVIERELVFDAVDDFEDVFDDV